MTKKRTTRRRYIFYEVAKPTAQKPTVTPTKTVTKQVTNQVHAWYDKPTDRKIRHTGRPEDNVVQLYVNMAWEVSGGDWDFIRTLEAENGVRNPHRQSWVISKSWVREDSRWFCQLHRAWHSDIVDDPRFWESPKRQMEQCWKKYKWWTRFYGYDVRHGVNDRFITL